MTAKELVNGVTAGEQSLKDLAVRAACQQLSLTSLLYLGSGFQSLGRAEICAYF